MITGERPRTCCMCGAIVIVTSSTTPHPEAPEMIRLPPCAAIGFVQGDHAPEMVLTCSDKCRADLLSQ